MEIQSGLQSSSKVKVYVPGEKFSIISVTGVKCSLNCKHCGRKYLKGMIQADTPNKFLAVCEGLAENEGIGCMISGGFNREGKLPIQNHLKAITKAKRKFNFILGVHPGLVSRAEAEALASAEIDFVSYDFIWSDEAIRKVLGIKATKWDYLRSLEFLVDSGIGWVVPHICVGINFGKIDWEFEALEILSQFKFPLIIFIILSPTRGTAMENVKPPSASLVRELMIKAKKYFSEVSLGCMRPRGEIRIQYERVALEAYADRIANPSKKLIKQALEGGWRVTMYTACCGIPSWVERRIQGNDL